MTLSAEAIEAIAGYAENAQTVEHIDVDGVGHFIHQGTLSPPIVNGHPPALKLRTLSGVVDYLVANRDGLDLSKVTVVVDSPSSVLVVGPALKDGRRQTHLVANEPDVSRQFGSFVNRFMDIESFIVGCQQRFRPGFGDIAAILAVVGNIQQNDVRQVEDDGVSQAVTARAGITKVGLVSVPSPCILVPRRSFPEVELSGVPFVLRIKKGLELPQVALFEADGDAWMVDATAKIRDFICLDWDTKCPTDDAENVVPFGVLA